MNNKMELLKFTELNDWREKENPPEAFLASTHRRPEETGSKAGNPPCHCKCNLFKCSIFQEIPFGPFPPMKGRTLKCSSGPSE